MGKPDVVCPAAKEVYLKSSSDEYVVICGIVYAQYEKGDSNFPNYTVVPSHCEKDRYTMCTVWREEKRKGWAREHAYSSLEQREQIRL